MASTPQSKDLSKIKVLSDLHQRRPVRPKKAPIEKLSSLLVKRKSSSITCSKTKHSRYLLYKSCDM